VAVQVSSPVTPEESGTPTACAADRTVRYIPAGSHSCQGRNTSQMRVAAVSTMARTVQLITVPK